MINPNNSNENYDETEKQKSIKIYYLRKLIKNGEYFLASVLSFTLLKLVLKYKKMMEQEIDEQRELNKIIAKSLLIIISIIRYGKLDVVKNKIDNDTLDRMMYVCNKLINIENINKIEINVLLSLCNKNFSLMLLSKRKEEENKKREMERQREIESGTVSFDKIVSIRQLKGVQFNIFDGYEDDDINILKATNEIPNNISNNIDLRTRLSRIHQLTGFSDPIYAEAAVTVHQFDIILDFLIINNTNKTLQNLNLELHTSGDLKIVEKPNKMTLAPKQSKRIEASIKVSSTENGVIFGNIVYDTTGATSDKNIVVMNCIHMDIMDYVHPEFCTETKFREMWVEFEWENKVPVNTDINNLNKYIQHIANITNMQLLTKPTPYNNNDNNKPTTGTSHPIPPPPLPPPTPPHPMSTQIKQNMIMDMELSYEIHTDDMFPDVIGSDLSFIPTPFHTDDNTSIVFPEKIGGDLSFIPTPFHTDDNTSIVFPEKIGGDLSFIPT
eukprot:333283_1